MTPIAFVRAIALAYEKYGRDPAAAFKHACIAGEATDDPDARITASQFEVLSWFAMRELDDEALGWFSRKLPWGTYGMLCRASLTAPDLEVALKRWRRHHRVLTEDILLDLSVEGGQASIGIAEMCDLGPFRELCLVTSLRYVLGYACWAINSKIALTRAEFPFAEPPHSAIYPVLFSPGLRFCAPRARISFDSRYLALPLKRDEAALNQMLQRALLLTVLPYRRDRLLVERVQLMLRGQAGDFPNAGDVAERLNVSPRTLHRQLLKEGASLRQLKEAARKKRAIDALTRSSRPIKRIALAAGYQSEKSFSRAFRQWTDASPREYRARARAFFATPNPSSS